MVEAEIVMVIGKISILHRFYVMEGLRHQVIFGTGLIRSFGLMVQIQR